MISMVSLAMVIRQSKQPWSDSQCWHDGVSGQDGPSFMAAAGGGNFSVLVFFACSFIRKQSRAHPASWLKKAGVRHDIFYKAASKYNL